MKNGTLTKWSKIETQKMGMERILTTPKAQSVKEITDMIDFIKI